MARIIGVEVPPNKRIDIALRSIYGIGPVNAIEVLERANIDPSIRAKDLTEAQLSQIVHAIQEGKYVIEGDLRRELGLNLKRLQAIKCYRGIRHLRSLPVREPQSLVRLKHGSWTNPIWEEIRARQHDAGVEVDPRAGWHLDQVLGRQPVAFLGDRGTEQQQRQRGSSPTRLTVIVHDDFCPGIGSAIKARRLAAHTDCHGSDGADR